MVKAMPSSPAASSVASRRAGSLSGAPRCAARSSRSDSSIIPCEGATVLSAASSRFEIAPALACGNSPVSLTTSSHIARR